MQQYFTGKQGIFGVAIALVIGLAGCASPPPGDSDNATESGTPTSDTAASDVADDSPIDVVASYSVICDLTDQIAADAVDLNCLISPDQDPHT
jgi:ABC-type Zn uptake system ZnuABC Zn-binding protein ZnuA